MARIHASYYDYSPSQPAAGVFAALFGLAFLVTLFQAKRTRAWIWLVMVFAIAMETVGYGARVASAGDVYGRTIYIIQFVCIILAPVFMAGIIYVVFGRIAFHVVPPESRTVKLLWIPARWITPIFVGFDIFALLLQLVGAVMISATQVTDKNAKDKLTKGKDIANAGVTLQIAAFGLFTFVAARFHFVSKRFRASLESKFVPVPNSKFVTMEGDERRFRPKWRLLLYVVNLSCIMIVIRSIYREIDFRLGRDGGYVSTHEWLLYALDAAPIFLCCAGFNVFTPGDFVPMGWRQPKAKAVDQTSEVDLETMSTARIVNNGHSTQSRGSVE